LITSAAEAKSCEVDISRCLSLAAGCEACFVMPLSLLKCSAAGYFNRTISNQSINQSITPEGSTDKMNNMKETIQKLH